VTLGMRPASAIMRGSAGLLQVPRSTLVATPAACFALRRRPGIGPRERSYKGAVAGDEVPNQPTAHADGRLARTRCVLTTPFSGRRSRLRRDLEWPGEGCAPSAADG
jgi:hypothetical protein